MKDFIKTRIELATDALDLCNHQRDVSFHKGRIYELEQLLDYLNRRSDKPLVRHNDEMDIRS